MIRTYGRLQINPDAFWFFDVPPHVLIKLKAVFPKIRPTAPPPIRISRSGEAAQDIEWFLSRFPMQMSEDDRSILAHESDRHQRELDSIEAMLATDIAPGRFAINGELRPYQAQAVEMYLRKNRLLCGDDVGLGKTLVGIGSLTDPENLPALVVCQAHLPKQWAGQIVRFLGAKVHILKKSTPYGLPHADVYISSYHKLAGWSEILRTGRFRSVIFDECQELRRSESEKTQAARIASGAAKRVLGLTATPVYNYGDEIFSVMESIKPGSMGNWNDFEREWMGYSKQVKDPKALGSWLRDQQLFLRRTREQVQRELPAVNRVVQPVEHHHDDEKTVMDLAKALARRTMTGSFTERGQAARELDIMLRMATGVGKARSVAAFVRLFLDNGEPVLLMGWHRSVYDIWLKELAEFNPVLYTGSESGAEKDRAKEAFLAGRTNLMIMSLRSGVGLDGLQDCCQNIVFGEFDWSPAVHLQAIGRLQRDRTPGSKMDGRGGVTACFLKSDWGSDPVMVDVLGLKASQAEGIVNPTAELAIVQADDSRLKELARRFLGEGDNVRALKEGQNGSDGMAENQCEADAPEQQILEGRDHPRLEVEAGHEGERGSDPT